MSPIDALINQLQQLAESQGLPAGFAQFLQYYYEDADIDDLNHYALPQLLAGARSHFTLLASRDSAARRVCAACSKTPKRLLRPAIW